MEEGTPTMIIDEVDTFMSKDREMHGVINSGHLRDSAYLLRGTSKGVARRYTTWAPKVLIGIDAASLSEILTDRAVVIELRRKGEGVRRAHLRIDRLKRALRPTARRACRWAQDNMKAIAKANPRVPRTLNDRARDNWRPLLSIAQVAGPRWSDLAFQTAERFGQAAEDAPVDSPGVHLLGDIRQCFDTAGVDKMTTADLLAALNALEESPWSTWERGRPLTPIGLATLLRKYKIQPKQLRFDDSTPRGYERQQFDAAFVAYLPKKPKHPKQD
jgi:putative DNA primase/helicase